MYPIIRYQWCITKLRCGEKCAPADTDGISHFLILMCDFFIFILHILRDVKWMHFSWRSNTLACASREYSSHLASFQSLDSSRSLVYSRWFWKNRNKPSFRQSSKLPLSSRTRPQVVVPVPTGKENWPSLCSIIEEFTVYFSYWSFSAQLRW